MAESLWASLKKELVYRRTFETIEQARLETFDWLNWYNNIRLHSSIGYISPVSFEELRSEKVA
jgi:transposase InsO family protein